MKDLDERIYELLESKKGSLSINEISESISDSTKQDITRKLLEMNRQGIVYKKIKEGKAYYSINSKDGEGRNASQENINNINKVFAAFGNKQALNDMGVFNKIENVSCETGQAPGARRGVGSGGRTSALKKALTRARDSRSRFWGSWAFKTLLGVPTPSQESPSCRPR